MAYARLQRAATRRRALGIFSPDGDGYDSRALVDDAADSGSSSGGSYQDPVYTAPVETSIPIVASADPVPHFDVQLPPALLADVIAAGTQPLTMVSTSSGYPRDYEPSDFPTTIVTDQSGAVVDPADLMVVVDQMGTERIVPKLTATAPSVITAYTPDVIEWREWPGTGGLVEQKFINGVATNEGRPWKLPEQMNEAERRAYAIVSDPGSVSSFLPGATDYAGASTLTDSVKQTIAILNAAGATTAANVAAAAVGSSVAAATQGVKVAPPVVGTRPKGGAQATPSYTGATRPIATSHRAADTGVIGSAPVVTVLPEGAGSSFGNKWLWAIAGLGALYFFGRK